MDIAEIADDPMLDEFIRDMGDGSLFLKDIVRYCRILHNSGRGGGAVSALAQLGGKKLTNVTRDVHNLLRGVYDSGWEPFEYMITTLNSDGSKTKKASTVLLSFEALAEMWKAGRKPFDRVMLGGHPESALLAFWDNLAEEDIEPHPVNTDEYWSDKRDRTFPLYIHADGVQIYTHTTYTVVSVSSALTSDQVSFDQQLLLLTLESSTICNETIADLVDLVDYIGDVLKSGRRPYLQPCTNTPWPADSHRAMHAGEPLFPNETGDVGYYAAFVGWQGDLKEKVEQHRYERNYHCNFLCEFCGGCKHLAHCNAYDFSPHCLWRRSCITHNQYLAQTAERYRSAWARLDWWTIWRCLWDLLHLLWLGIVKDILGSELLRSAQELVTEMDTIETLNAALARLHSEFAIACRFRKESPPSSVWTTTTLGYNESTSCPVVHAKMKGAECKRVFMWLAKRTNRKACSLCIT